MKIICYTAIFGNFPDRLYDSPAGFPEDVPRHCYSDVEESRRDPASGWLLLPPKWRHAGNSRLRARRHKLLPHQLYPDIDYSLWVDGCLTPLTDPRELVERYLQDCDICLFKHMQRSCIYEEGRACKQLRKDHPGIIDRVMRRYREEGYPPDRGLVETTAVLRRHTPAVNEFNELWWSEVRDHSIRDQLSYDYCEWKTGMTHNVFEGTRCRSPHFEWRSHR